MLDLDTEEDVEIKVIETNNLKNGIQNGLKAASRQNAKQIILYLTQEYSQHEIYHAFKSSLQGTRAQKIHTMIMRHSDGTIKVYNLNELRKSK